MIPALFLGHTILLAVLGTIMLGWLSIKLSMKWESPLPLLGTAIALAIGLVCAGIVSHRFDGQINASAVVGASVVATLTFVILAFSSSSFLTHAAERVERRRKLRPWLKVSISIALTLWLGMMTASTNGLIKSTFFLAGIAEYKLTDNGFGYLSHYREEAQREAQMAMSACQIAIDRSKVQKMGVSFRAREQSWLGWLSREASYYDSLIGEKRWPQLEVSSQLVGSRGGYALIRKIRFDAGPYGTCVADAGSIDLRVGSVTPATIFATKFARTLSSIETNFANLPINAVPWYAFGANEAISEVNLKIFDSEPTNSNARLLDDAIFWLSKIFFGYVILFLAARIRKDLST